MKTPRVVRLLSVLPGLGLIVLGRVALGFAVMAFITMAILTLPGLVAPDPTIFSVAFVVILLVWGVQAQYAVVIAQRMERANQGRSLPQREVPMEPPPSSASSSEKLAFKAKKAITQFLPPGAELRSAIIGDTFTTPIGTVLLGVLTGSSLTPQELRKVRMLYVGITRDTFVIVKTDPFGEPSDLQQVPLAQAKLTEYKKGVLSDQLTIGIGGTEPLRFRVHRNARRESQLLASLLPNSIGSATPTH